MPDLFLLQRLSEPTFTRNLALNGVVDVAETESIQAEVAWRWDDEPDMEPQKLGVQTAGHTLDVPFELKGRAIRLFLVSKTKTGRLSVRDIKEATQITFDPGKFATGGERTVPAGEDLLENDLINFYDDGGTDKARKADATDLTKPAQGFAVAAADSGDPVRVFLGGNTMTGLTGRTTGSIEYLSTTPGEMSETPPVTAGNAIQQIGHALSETSVQFEPLVAIPVGGLPDSPPSALTVTFDGIDTVDLAWTNNGGTGNNLIERRIGAGGGFSTLDIVSSATNTYADMTLPINNETYHYRVRNASVAGYSNEDADFVAF